MYDEMLPVDDAIAYIKPVTDQEPVKAASNMLLYAGRQYGIGGSGISAWDRGCYRTVHTVDVRVVRSLPRHLRKLYRDRGESPDQIPPAARRRFEHRR